MERRFSTSRQMGNAGKRLWQLRLFCSWRPGKPSDYADYPQTRQSVLVRWNRARREGPSPPLGTRNSDAAHRIIGKLERALAEGTDSSLWPELKQFLPEPTFRVFANAAGYKEPIVKAEPTWADLSAAFENELHRRVALDKLRESTAVRYRHAAREFSAFLDERKISFLKTSPNRLSNLSRFGEPPGFAPGTSRGARPVLPWTRRYCTESSPLALNTKSSKKILFAWRDVQVTFPNAGRSPSLPLSWKS